jgi:hypothetical protein
MVRFFKVILIFMLGTYADSSSNKASAGTYSITDLEEEHVTSSK